MQHKSSSPACEHLRPRILALIDGELAPGECDSIIEHLATCHECLAYEHQAVVAISFLRQPSTVFVPRARIATSPNPSAGSATDSEELQRLRQEMVAMQTAILELQSQLAHMRQLIDLPATRQVARPLNPYAAPVDLRLRGL